MYCDFCYQGIKLGTQCCHTIEEVLIFLREHEGVMFWLLLVLLVYELNILG